MRTGWDTIFCTYQDAKGIFPYKCMDLFRIFFIVSARYIHTGKLLLLKIKKDLPMKPLLLMFIALTFLGLRVTFAQTTNANPVDDDFNVGLLVGAIIVLSVMAGAMIIGFIAATMILIFLFGL